MKVLVVASYNAGRFAPFVVEQVAALQQHGIQIDFFGIRGKGALGYLRNLPALKKKIVDFQPDIIHAHYGLSAILPELQQKIPVVSTFHNGEILNLLVNFCSSLMSLRAIHVIYVAPHIREALYFKAENYSILPCGINLPSQTIDKDIARKQLHFSPDKKYILFGGAFNNKRKNVQLLYDALALMNHDDIVVLEMKGLSRDEITLRMFAADCFCLPSKSEGSPQALKEAMACDLPIVSTNVGDVAHLLDGLDGCYVSYSRNPQELASLLRQALAFPSRTQGRQRIIDLGLTNDQVAHDLISIYNQVLAQ